LQVIIPMAGLGSRFLKKGYMVPKPLVDVNGYSMIELVLGTLGIKGKYFFVVRPELDIEEVHTVIKKKLNHYQFILSDKITEGPACSVLLCENHIDVDDELVVANCDQIMDWDSSLFLELASRNDGTVVTYHSDTPHNSYAKINKFSQVIEIKEKEVISNVSLNGIHYWKKAKFFIESARQMIKADDRAPNGEFYVGPTYNYMIANGLSVGVYHVPNQMHHSVGAPKDLERYLSYAKV